MKKDIFTLDHYLSRFSFPAVIFDKNGEFINASSQFLFLFPKELTESTDYQDIFKKYSEIKNSVEKVLSSRSRVLIHEVKFKVSDKEFVYNLDIFPIEELDSSQLEGVALHFYEINKDHVFLEQKKRSDILDKAVAVTSGLAHEIKNPLAGLKGAAQLILGEKDQGRIKEYVDIILRETGRIDDLVRELLDFSKTKELKFEERNLNQILFEIIEREKLRLPKNIHILTEFDPSLPDVKVDDKLIHQVFSNLVQNAIEATSKNDEGFVWVKSKVVTDFVLKKDKIKKKFISVQIQDDGQGMSEDILKNIFIPYYSTKKKGTGLGLAIANKIIEQHGGTIVVNSKLGEGAKFQVYLPI